MFPRMCVYFKFKKKKKRTAKASLKTILYGAAACDVYQHHMLLVNKLEINGSLNHLWQLYNTIVFSLQVCV